MPKQDGGPILRSNRETCRGIQHIRPRQLSGSSTMIGSRKQAGILAILILGLNSSDLFKFRDAFSLAGKGIPWQSTGVWTDALAARHFHMCSHCTDHTAQMTCVLGSRGLRAQEEFCAEKHSFIHASCLALCCTRH